MPFQSVVALSHVVSARMTHEGRGVRSGRGPKETIDDILTGSSLHI